MPLHSRKCSNTHTHARTLKLYVWETERPSPWKQTSCSPVSHHPAPTSSPTPKPSPPLPPPYELTSTNPPQPPLLPLCCRLSTRSSILRRPPLPHSQHHPSRQSPRLPKWTVFLFFSFFIPWISVTLPHYYCFLHRKTPPSPSPAPPSPSTPPHPNPTQPNQQHPPHEQECVAVLHECVRDRRRELQKKTKKKTHTRGKWRVWGMGMPTMQTMHEMNYPNVTLSPQSTDHPFTLWASLMFADRSQGSLHNRLLFLFFLKY